MLTILICALSHAQGTVEAEFDTIYNYAFEALKGTHSKKILIDESHNTIYSLPYGKDTAREMLRIMEEDGFTVEFTGQKLDSTNLNKNKPDILVIHGMPNDKIELTGTGKKEVMYKSPLHNEEVTDITKYVYNGGSLFLFLSHFPGGSGALPLLEAFSIKFRDGYAYHPNFPGHKCGLCSHFIMTKKNDLINTNHPVLTSRLSEKTLPETVKFLCGAAIFRNPEDNILSFPKNTINFSPTSDRSMDIEEGSDAYAGMIGFNFGAGRVIVCTDQGIFRSLNLLIDGEKIPVTIHDPECDNAGLFLNSIRWLSKLQE
ncbi:hypothetical protein DX873_00050 [Flagellimonas nanhaiensis]|uniref:Uncharacterized protein n=1 Tax=Flagellimonas nanhaiensis TaxID=2292706 RepID=A0A371JS18_9FLAO|nr:hypothetical protein DX873_00050 [Allomuricauda nanhaiensis]